MGCGSPLVGDVEPAREERRIVTILFADLVGFTARSERLDPEDVRAFLLPYYEVLTADITGHGGRVDRFLGDGIMAVFGAPVAHEDDPERAVRAALRIVDRVPALGLDLQVRIGINTGPVLFAAGSGDRDDAVTGDAVNTAARLQAAAPANGVVVGEATYAATGRLFRFEALPAITAKGKAEPVPLWRPLAPIARPVTALGRAESAPFVGRDLELSLLGALFERSRVTPSLEIATIVAEPGMGKSRLVRELARRVDALPDLVTWRAGRCLPYGEGIGFWPLGEIVKAHAGILETDGQEVIAAKLDAVLTEPDPATRSWMRDRIGPLVGLRVGAAPPQQEEAFTAWRRFLESVARTRPVVLVIEDLHWADNAMVAFLGHLAAHAAGLPIMLIATARPEIEERHPAWLGRARRATVISLATLPGPAMAAIVTATMPGASADLVATVVERAGGSPLYAEQLGAMLRERGPDASAEPAVPSSLQALLASRIDALPADAKPVLLDAAVVGKTFWSGAVATLAGRTPEDVEPALTELVRRELVRRVEPPSMAGEAEFAFVHALVREVAYAELPRNVRIRRHRAVAEWTRGLASAHGETAEVVVAHLDRARELASSTAGAAAEAGAIEAELADALLDAADHATGTHPARAIGQLRRALDLLAGDDQRRAGANARLGRALLATFDYAGAAGALDEAMAELRSAGDVEGAASIAVPLAVSLGNAGEAARAEVMLGEVRALLGDAPSPALVAVVAQQAMQATVAMHADRAIELAEVALALAATLGLPPPHRALAARGVSRFGTEPTPGAADLRAAIELAEAAGDLRSAAVAYYNLAARQADQLGSGAALATAEEAIAFCRARGLPTEVMRGGRLEMLLDTGGWDELLDEAAELRAWASERGDTFTLVFTDRAVATVRLERGEPTGPLEWMLDAVREAGYPQIFVAAIVAEAALVDSGAEAARRVLAASVDATPHGEVQGAAVLARACVRAGAPDLGAQALALGVQPGFSSETELAAAAAAIAEATGELAVARAHFEHAAEGFGRRGDVHERAHALAGLGRCLVGLGEREAGAAHLREAREAWVRLRATPRIADIDALLRVTG